MGEDNRCLQVNYSFLISEHPATTRFQVVCRGIIACPLCTRWQLSGDTRFSYVKKVNATTTIRKKVLGDICMYMHQQTSRSGAYNCKLESEVQACVGLHWLATCRNQHAVWSPRFIIMVAFDISMFLFWKKIENEVVVASLTNLGFPMK